MPSITTSDGIHLHVKDRGHGRPVVLIHGWPLTGDMFEYQELALLEAGYRVITYDRRGFGQSGHPADGYHYDILADDLAAVMAGCDLSGACLLGFSMGGGEVARYLSRHGAGRVRQAVLVSSVVPYLIHAADNPDGVEASQFEQMKQQLRQDRFHFLAQFAKKFYGVGYISSPVSKELLDWTFLLAVMASPKATIDCVDAFARTDFRPDLPFFTCPTLVIHGSGDQIVPIDLAGRRAAEGIPGARFIAYEGAPHGLFATHHERLNQDLIDFLGG